MKVFFDASSDAVTPLFQVEDGICQDSLGIQCAVAMGLPEEFTTRAEEVGIGSEWKPDLQGHSRRQARRALFRSRFNKEPRGSEGHHEDTLPETGLDESVLRRSGLLREEAELHPRKLWLFVGTNLSHKGLVWEGKDRIATTK